IRAELGHPVIDALVLRLGENVSRAAEQRQGHEHQKSSEKSPHVFARVQRVCPRPAASITCHSEPPELRRRSRSSGGRSKDPLLHNPEGRRCTVRQCFAERCRAGGGVNEALPTAKPIPVPTIVPWCVRHESNALPSN